VALLGEKMAKFHADLVCCWHDGVYEELITKDVSVPVPNYEELNQEPLDINY